MGEFFKVKKMKERKFKPSKEKAFKPLKMAKGLITVALGLTLFGAAQRSLP